MINMRKIILCSAIITMITCFVACDKNDDGGADKNSVKTNGYRVKHIEGNNKIWGDYQLLFYYSDNKLDSVYRCDLNTNIAKRDTTGSFAMFVDKYGGRSFTIHDRVLAIDADSVARLKAAYPDTYQDTLRKRRTTTTLYTNDFDALAKKEVIKKYKPREEFGLGKNFRPGYLNLTAKTNVLEYDKAGNPIIVRQFCDTYVQEEKNNTYERELYKYELDYSGDMIVGVRYYIQNSHDNLSWSIVDHYTLNYQDGVLMSVDGDSYSLKRTGNTIVVKENGETTTYTLDSNGNAIRADYSDGSYVKVEYEKASGNFSNLVYSYIDRVLGKDVIK